MKPMNRGRFFLSQQQVLFFRHAGYLKLPHRLSRRLVKSLRSAVELDMRQEIDRVVRSSSGRAVRLNDVMGRGSIFREVFTSNALLDPLESLLGPNMQLVLNRHNHATITPSDAPTPRLHRDVLQWTRDIVTAIVYLEEATVQNGCTMVIPWSQFLPFVGTPNNGGTWMDEHSVYSDLVGQALPVPMPAGGILLFDSLMFHSTGPNRTDELRPIITMGYRAVDELADGRTGRTMLVRGEEIYKGR